MRACGISIFLSLLLSLACSKNISSDVTSSIDHFGHTRNRPVAEINQKMKSQKKNLMDKFTDLIPADYSIHDPPPLINNKAVPVKFSLSLKNIPEINELKQMISIEMNLRVYWQDLRLTPGADLIFERKKLKASRNYISLNPIILNKIWVPDIYTDYAKAVTSQRILSPPLSLRLYPNGTVRYSSRITIEMSCPMDFRMYPGDTQICDMRLESYGFTREELEFFWRYEGRTVNIGHRLPHFDYDVELVEEKGDVNFPSGSYPAISVCLRLHRRLSYHILQTYIPSSLFVITSWISYLVPIEYAPGRLAIGMTLLLTLTAMFGAIRQLTPSVSYIKALDIWMVACILFVFLSLAEFAFVLRIDKIMKLFDKSKNINSSPMNAEFEPLDEKGDKWNGKDDYENGVKAKKRTPSMRRASRINGESLSRLRRLLETISSIMSPILFIVFNLIYWPWLLFSTSGSNEC